MSGVVIRVLDQNLGVAGLRPEGRNRKEVFTLLVCQCLLGRFLPPEEDPNLTSCHMEVTPSSGNMTGHNVTRHNHKACLH